MLLVLTGAGDELQGMKKGIMELADCLIVHKADGDNLRLAKKTVREYRQLLHFLQPATPGWTTTALPVSSLERTGFETVWETIKYIPREMEASGVWHERRQFQTKDWFHSMIRDRLIDSFFSQQGKKELVADLEKQLLTGEMTVASAVDSILPLE